MARANTGEFVLNAPTHQDPNGGLWTGFFETVDKKQVSQVCALHFKAGVISCDSKSADPIGAYSVQGTYTPPAKPGTTVVRRSVARCGGVSAATL